jgi:hypothetical protein
MCTSLAASSLLPVTRLVWPERSGAFSKHPRQGRTNSVAGFFSTAPGSRARNIGESLGSLIRAHRSDCASTVRSLRGVHYNLQPPARLSLIVDVHVSSHQGTSVQVDESPARNPSEVRVEHDGSSPAGELPAQNVRPTVDYRSISRSTRLRLVRYLFGWISDSSRDQGSLPGHPNLCRSAERKVRDGLEYPQDAETGRHSPNRHLQSRALH